MKNKCIVLMTIVLIRLAFFPVELQAAVGEDLKYYLFKSEGLTDELFSAGFGAPRFDYPLRKFAASHTDYSIAASAVVENSTFHNSFHDGKNNRFFASNRVLLHFGENLVIYNEMVFDQQLTDDPSYSGKVWRKDLAGYTKAAFCEYNKDFFSLKFGTYPVDMGVSNFDNLLFSETSEGFSKLHLSFAFDKFSFDTFVGKLNDEERNISMHRFRYQPFKYLYLGIVESVVYGGDLKFKYANPFTFYHGVQLNDQHPANTIGSFEVESYLTDNFRLYGSFLLDDYQFDHKETGDLEPNEIGWNIGFSWKDIYFQKDLLEYEYSAITNRTFNTSESSGVEKFMLGKTADLSQGAGEYLGSKLGNDFDVHRIRYAAFFGANKVALSFAYLRNGEGAPELEWDSPWTEYSVEEGYSEPFPTGTVEYLISYRAEYKRIVSRYLEAFVYADYDKIMNESDEFEAGITLKLNLNYLDL